MKIHWLTQNIEQVSTGFDWLHPSEKTFLNGLKFQKRRDDWLLGRWTAKQLVVKYLRKKNHPLTLNQIEIRKAQDGAPEVFILGKKADCNISLSHSHGIGFCTIGTKENKLGCDLEKIESRSPNFIKDYFTNEEQSFIFDQGEEKRSLYTNLIWSAKESTLKAMRTGLSMDPRKVHIDFTNSKFGDKWQSFRAMADQKESQLFGYWKDDFEFVFTFVINDQMNHISPI